MHKYQLSSYVLLVWAKIVVNTWDNVGGEICESSRSDLGLCVSGCGLAGDPEPARHDRSALLRRADYRWVIVFSYLCQQCNRLSLTELCYSRNSCECWCSEFEDFWGSPHRPNWFLKLCARSPKFKHSVLLNHNTYHCTSKNYFSIERACGSVGRSVALEHVSCGTSLVRAWLCPTTFLSMISLVLYGFALFFCLLVLFKGQWRMDVDRLRK